MARKVGSLHAHKLPDSASKEVGRYDVFRCECNKEFFMDMVPGKAGAVESKWLPLDSSPHYVEYSPEETDAPRIGRWTPDMAKPAAEENTESDEVSEPAADNVDNSTHHTSEGGESHGDSGQAHSG